MSVLESLLSTLPYPMLMAEKMRKPRAARQHQVGTDDGDRPRRRRLARDQLSDGAALARRVRDARSARVWRTCRSAIMLGGPERGEFFEKAQPWLSERTVAEIVELSQAMRIPATPVNDGATVLDCPQYRRARVLRRCRWRRTGRSGGRARRSGCRRPRHRPCGPRRALGAQDRIRRPGSPIA